MSVQPPQIFFLSVDESSYITQLIQGLTCLTESQVFIHWSNAELPTIHIFISVFIVPRGCLWLTGKRHCLPTFLFATTSQRAFGRDFCYVPLITAHVFLGGLEIMTRPIWCVQQIQIGMGSVIALKNVLFHLRLYQWNEFRLKIYCCFLVNLLKYFQVLMLLYLNK